MTADEFRSLALALPDAIESSHMNHPDFRANGRIFATLSYPEEEWGMVKLTPEQQAGFLETDSHAFAPAKGGWGRQGCTNVLLKAAQPRVVEHALRVAWENAASKPRAARKRAPRAS